MFLISYAVEPGKEIVDMTLSYGNLQQYSTDEIKNKINSICSDVVNNLGYIKIMITPENGSSRKPVISPENTFTKYITYLPRVIDGSLYRYRKTDFTEMIVFSNWLQSHLHEDIYGKANPNEQIAILLTTHFLQGRRKDLSEEQINGLQSYMIELQAYIDKQITKGRS